VSALSACRSAAALLVFDITDVDSFTRVKSWVKELRQMAGARHAPRNTARRFDRAPVRR
jgi:GTPase SAR1 family protein